MSPDEFLRSLAFVPWFSRLGRPNPRDRHVARICDWNEWPGPESPRVGELGARTQAWYEELLEGAGSRRQEVEDFWNRVFQAVFEHAKGAVPFDPKQDAWHGPTAAVWHAAWVAGVVGCCHLLGREIPAEAIEQWSWLLEGHWPCGYSSVPVEGEPFVIMVM